MSVFGEPTSKFSTTLLWKTMASTRDTGNYIGLGWSPTSNLRGYRVHVARFECSKGLQQGTLVSVRVNPILSLVGLRVRRTRSAPWEKGKEFLLPRNGGSAPLICLEVGYKRERERGRRSRPVWSWAREVVVGRRSWSGRPLCCTFSCATSLGSSPVIATCYLSRHA